ncbi:MAG TPA: hypothetical protein VF641_02035 [Methylobacterium sp.]
MTDDKSRPSLKDFDASADNNGDIGQADPRDVGIAARTQSELRSNPMGEAQSARIASGTPGEDATDATEAETPAENLKHIGDASQPDAKASEAIDRATASVGKEDDA